MVRFFFLNRRSDNARIPYSRARSKGGVGTALSLCAFLVDLLILLILLGLPPTCLLGLSHNLLRRRCIPPYSPSVRNLGGVDDFPGEVSFDVDGILRTLFDHKRRLLFFGEQKSADAP